MSFRSILDSGYTRLQRIDWVLLGLMVGITQNRFFALKILAIAAALFLTPCLRYMRQSGLHFFYLAMAAWTVIQYALTVRDYTAAYSIVAAYACVQWLLMAIIAAMLLSEANRSYTTARQSLDVYFWIVAGLSVINLVSVIIHSGVWNPYEHAPEPVYGMSSGDHVAGLFGFHLWKHELGDYSNVNAAVLSLFTTFFFVEKAWAKAALAGFLMLATSSNFITITTLTMIAGIVLLERRRAYLLAGIAAVGITVSFYVVVTPKNFHYIVEQLSDKMGIEGGVAQNHRAPAKRHLPIARINSRRSTLPFDPDRTAGKAYSFQQTYSYLARSPAHFFFGAGPGRYSSLLALLASSPPSIKGRIFRPLDFQSREYRTQHGWIVAVIKRLPPRYHTVSQLPYAWYNQVWGEYGLIGFLLFVSLYVGWSVRRAWLKAGKFLLATLLLVLLTDYTYETFCIVPVFEWLLLVSRAKRTAAAALPGIRV